MTKARRGEARRRGDGAAGTLGAILVLGVLVMALLYVNAFRVPEEGAAGERLQARVLAGEVGALAAGVATTTEGASRTLPLTLSPGGDDPSVLSGIVLDPRAPSGTVAFQPDAFRVRVSHVTPAGATVYDAGNATARLALGRIAVTTDGHYVTPLAYAVEAGAALHGAGDAFHVTHPPAWSWETRADGSRVVALTLPRLTGDALALAGSPDHTVTLTTTTARAAGTRDLATAGGVTIEIESRHASAWGAYLNRTFAPHTAIVDAGVATVTLEPPASGSTLGLTVAYVEHRVGIT